MRFGPGILVALALLVPAAARAQYVDVVVPSTADPDDPAFIDDPDLPPELLRRRFGVLDRSGKARNALREGDQDDGLALR